MTILPDAPWIREAEMYGMPPYEDYVVNTTENITRG